MAGAVCGAVGTPILQYLIDEYTWRGAMLVLGAITLNVIPCGMIAHHADIMIQKHKKCNETFDVTSDYKSKKSSEESSKSDSIVIKCDNNSQSSDPDGNFSLINSFILTLLHFQVNLNTLFAATGALL